MESLNTTYQPYVVVSEVLELWQFHSYQTGEIPESQSDLQMRAKAFRQMHEDIKVIKKQVADYYR